MIAFAAAALVAAPALPAVHRLRPIPPSAMRPERQVTDCYLCPDRPGGQARTPYTLIQLKHGHGREAAPLLRRSGAERLSSSMRLWRLRTELAASLLPLLRLGNAVRAVQPDRAVRSPAAHLAAGDPLLGTAYWLSRVGADLVEPPGPGKPVAVIDTGLDSTHPEFAQRPETTLLNAQHVEGDDDDHGTGVASLVGAPANGIGLVGVYPQAALQSWDASLAGSGNLTLGDEVSGILAAAARGPGVINLSIGSEDYEPLEEEAILTALRTGSLVVASAGNEFQRGNPVQYPAGLNHVLTVAASTENDQPAYFSSASSSVDLAAPGDRLSVAAPIAYAPGGYRVDSGTSFSAPIVSGATAWVWTQRPELDNTQMFELVRRSARDVWDPGYDRDTGFGVLDIPRALTIPAPPPDPLEPNDDIEQVKPRGLFAEGARPLTSTSRRRAVLNARLDAFEDPDDVYRIYVPPRQAVSVFVVGERDVDLALWGPRTRTVLERGRALKRDLLGASERRGKRQELVRYRNPGRNGLTLYADVFAGSGMRSVAYALSVTPVPARR